VRAFFGGRDSKNLLKCKYLSFLKSKESHAITSMKVTDKC
jgi:hypothetical protein